jgi:hypothetical protein
MLPLVLLILVRVPLEMGGRHLVDHSRAAPWTPYDSMALKAYRSLEPAPGG